jgi:hypothetical protein
MKNEFSGLTWCCCYQCCRWVPTWLYLLFCRVLTLWSLSMLLFDCEVDAPAVISFWSAGPLIRLCLLHVVLVIYKLDLVQPVVNGGLVHIASLVPSRVRLYPRSGMWWFYVCWFRWFQRSPSVL